MGSVIQSTVDGKLEDNLTQLSYPISAVLEIEKAINGKGKYTYLDTWDRVKGVVERYFPANKALNTALVWAGLGNEQTQKDDNAIKGYYRWKFKNNYGGKYIGNPSEDLKVFRTGMRKAYDSFRNKEELKVSSRYAIEALKATGKDRKSARGSILGKRLLTKAKIAPGMSNDAFEERKVELRNTIGDEAYRRLELHDYLLKRWSTYF